MKRTSSVPRPWARMLSLGLFMLGSIALCPPAQAFKIETHLWVGQQVVNDLEDDGRISVKLNGTIVTIPVREDVKSAILANKNEYLLGNIGPDAFPDVVVGQSLMHPGQANGWKANDWMAHLLRTSANHPAGKAFAYGYLGHAAADVFSHTYVNQYAGDHFDLANETLVEERHIALEGYIARHTPPLRNSAGTVLGAPWTVVRPSDTLGAFLRDALIYDAQAQSQYAKAPYAAHLVAFHRYRTAIDRLAEDNVWREIDIAVAKYIAAQFGILLSSEEAGKVVAEIGRLNDKIKRGEKVTREEFTALHARIDRLDMRTAQAARSAIDRMQSLEASLIEAQNRYESLLVEKTCDLVDEVCRIAVPTIKCKWYGCFPDTKFVTDPVCAAAFRATCKTTQALLDLRNSALSTLLENRKKVNAELTNAYTDLVRARGSALQLANAMADFLAIPAGGSSPVQSILRNWRADTDIAMAEYVKAASQSLINTMDPAASALAPMQRWIDCYHRGLLGMPLVVSGCPTRDAAMQIVRTLDRMANLPGDVLASATGLPTSTQIAALRDRIQAQIINKLKDEVSDRLVDLLPEKVQGILRVLDETIDRSRLQYYFTKAETPSTLGLITIADIADRVDAEMSVTSGLFNTQRFATVYNAVVLAKLSLLDNAGLTQLAQLAGNLNGADGRPAFTGTDNMVAHAFTSLDGNHQWMPVAPPRPTVAGMPERRLRLPAGYPSTSGYSSAAGFVPWQAPLRNAIFRGLFIGPISPGVEAPFEIGRPDILPASYPYKPCAVNPFPNDETDHYCVGRLTPWTPPPVRVPVPRPPECGGGKICR